MFGQNMRSTQTRPRGKNTNKKIDEKEEGSRVYKLRLQRPAERLKTVLAVSKFVICMLTSFLLTTVLSKGKCKRRLSIRGDVVAPGAIAT